MRFSIIIPVYNGGRAFEACLAAVQRSVFADYELIVVDDGSTDGSDARAKRVGARVLSTGGRKGPAFARNLGASVAQGDYLFFTDADCALHPDTLLQIHQLFQNDPGLSALFGSYDDRPPASNLVAQYKNLFHHYVHQTSAEAASTFWTGCGAIRRDVFLALGGFDAARYPRPAIEDIDLGYRLSRQGGRIRLIKSVQVTHLKAWTFLSLLTSDIVDRGIPWTRLLLRQKAFQNDLNLQTQNRLSVIIIWLWLLLTLHLTLVHITPSNIITKRNTQYATRNTFHVPYPTFLIPPLLLLRLNRPLYQFFYRKRGLGFTLRVLPLHWLYYGYNGLSFGLGLLSYGWDKIKAER